MRAPVSRVRANRQDDQELAAMRDSQPRLQIARLAVRPKGTSNHKAIERERFGPYYVHECLGEGGMASVHRATRIDGTGGPVALKRLWAHLCDDKDFVEAFVQEARLARLLRHDNIAQAYELGKANGIYYIAMELVSGPTLDAVMRQSRTAAGAIPLPIIVEILIQLCDALAHAHDLKDELGRPLRLIHRDVSPANIILSSSGVVKLIDFGIAKAARSRVQTQAGFIKGKLAYVAPEYTHGKLDHRADLFAVGVVAHEMLTGHRLFAAETEVDTIHKVRSLPIAAPSRIDPKVSRELDDIVLTALQRDPDARWQNAAALGTALRAVAVQIGRVDSKEVARWVQWAFTREPWSESGIGRVLAGLEHTRAHIAKPDRGAPPTLPATPARKRQSLAAPAKDEESTTSSLLLDEDVATLDEKIPTFEDAPPTIPVARMDLSLVSRREPPKRGDLTQVVGRTEPDMRLRAVLVLAVLGLIALAAAAGYLGVLTAAVV